MIEVLERSYNPSLIESMSPELQRLLPYVASVTTQICAEVKRAGELGESTKGFGENGEIDICTEADRQIDEMLCAELATLYPGHDIISEESAAVRRENPKGTLFIDALDETSNYAGKDGKGEMDYGTLIASFDAAGVPEFAIMQMIARNEVYVYEKSVGAVKLTLKNGNVISQERISPLPETQKAGFVVRNDRVDLAMKYLPEYLQAGVVETDDVNLRSLQKLFEGELAGLAYTWKGSRQGGDWDMAAPIAIARALGIEVVAAQDGELLPVKLNPDDPAAISAGSVIFLAPGNYIEVSI